MAKSLNQAFIRAYSKVRSAESTSEQPQPVSPEDYIVRLDTSTVQVPAPHYLNTPGEKDAADPIPRGDRETVHAEATPQPTEQQAQQPSVSEAANAESHLREAIAREMLEASEWHPSGWGQSDWSQNAIGGSGGGLPTVSGQASRGDEATVRPVRRGFDPQQQSFDQNLQPAYGSVSERVVATTERLQAMASEADTQSETHKGVSRFHQNSDTEAYDLETAGSVEFARVDSPAKKTPEHSDNEHSENEHSEYEHSEYEHSDFEETEYEQSASDRNPSTKAPELESPNSPALQSPKMDTASQIQRELQSDLQAAQPGLTPDEVRKIVEDYVAKHRRSDEIFRLDSPSYPHESFAESDPQPSDEIESIDAENSVTETDLRGIAEDARKEIRELESHLREAATAAFHSGWEVDRLQWPEVCEELVRVREDKLSKMAHNLVGAVDEGLQVLAVTSPSGGEGRTTVACCLARMVATTGMRVALLDADIENPSLAPYTNIEVQSDWKSAIVNQLPIEEVAIYSIEDQLTLLPLTQTIDEEEFSSDDNRIAFMLHELAESFDLVIVDSGHMDSTRTVLSSLAEQGLINAVLTVVDHRISTPQRIEACIKRIRRSGVTSVGLVENFSA